MSSLPTSRFPVFRLLTLFSPTGVEVRDKGKRTERMRKAREGEGQRERPNAEEGNESVEPRPRREQRRRFTRIAAQGKQEAESESKGRDRHDCRRGKQEGPIFDAKARLRERGRHRKEEDRGGRRSDQG